MEYLLYNFTGISKPDGETKSVQLETVIRKKEMIDKLAYAIKE